MSVVSVHLYVCDGICVVCVYVFCVCACMHSCVCVCMLSTFLAISLLQSLPPLA